MNFSIDREILLDNLNLISRGLPVKTAMPVLNGIKLELTESDLFLTSSNSDLSIQIIINDPSLIIEQRGSIVIPGKFFIEIIRKINSKKINISLIEDKIAVIKAERSEFKLNLFDVFNYPNIDFVALDKPLTFDAKIIKQFIKETSYAASQSEKRPILTGVNLKYDQDKFTAIATDSFRLSQKIIYFQDLFDDFNLVIPNKCLDELSKTLDNYNEKVEIYFNNIKVLFKFKNILFQSRLLDGAYPDTSRLIPAEFPIITKFNKEDLISAIERVSLLSPKDKDNNYNVVRFCIREDQIIEISSTNAEIGTATEEILPCDPLVGSSLRIAFSSKYILDALRSFTSNEITLSFTGEVRPFILQGDNDLNLTHLILPIRVDW